MAEEFNYIHCALQLPATPEQMRPAVTKQMLHLQRCATLYLNTCTNTAGVLEVRGDVGGCVSFCLRVNKLQRVARSDDKRSLKNPISGCRYKKQFH